MQWWRAEVDRLAAGRPQHPITVALLGLRDCASHDPLLLHEALTAADLDLARMTYCSWTGTRGLCVPLRGIAADARGRGPGRRARPQRRGTRLRAATRLGTAPDGDAARSLDRLAAGRHVPADRRTGGRRTSIRRTCARPRPKPWPASVTRLARPDRRVARRRCPRLLSPPSAARSGPAWCWPPCTSACWIASTLRAHAELGPCRGSTVVAPVDGVDHGRALRLSSARAPPELPCR